MKEKFVFDELDDDIREIDETTVITDIGTSAERISEKVMKTINTNTEDKKTTKKGITKRIGITLIAAAVATAILGTVSAGAAGSFNSALGERFAGESVNGLYSGGDVHLSAKDTIDAQLTGIAGDDNHVMAAFQFKNKDGSAFAEDITNCYVYPCPADDVIVTESQNKDTFIYFAPEECSVTQSAWSRLKGEYNGASCQQEYSLVDEHTIGGYFNYNTSNRNIKGETMNCKHNKLYIYDVDKIIMNMKDFNGTEDDIRKMVNENQASLKNGQKVAYIVELDSYAVATESSFDIDLDASLKLNYKDTYATLTGEEGLAHKGVNYTLNSVKVSPFSLDLEIKLAQDENYKALEFTADDEEYGNAFENDFDTLMAGKSNISIVLKSGRKYLVRMDNMSGTGIENGDYLLLDYKYDIVNEKNEWVIVNPEEIDHIEFMNETIAK